MPMYESIDDLPTEIKRAMPREAQEVYLNAHQRFWQASQAQAAREGEGTLDEDIHRNAMDIVKGEYEQDEETGYWRPREDLIEE